MALMKHPDLKDSTREVPDRGVALAEASGWKLVNEKDRPDAAVIDPIDRTAARERDAATAAKRTKEA